LTNLEHFRYYNTEGFAGTYLANILKYRSKFMVRFMVNLWYYVLEAENGTHRV